MGEKMDRDHSLLQKVITGVNTDLGKKLNFELHSISYVDIPDIAYIAATTAECIAKHKFIKATPSKEKIYSTWDDGLMHQPLSIGHDTGDKYELIKLSLENIGEVVAVGWIDYDLVAMSALPSDKKPLKGKIYFERDGSPFTFLPGFPTDDKPEKGKIYVQRKGCLKYRLLDLQGNLVEGELNDSELEPEILVLLKNKILEEIVKRGHTKKDENKINYKFLDSNEKVVEGCININSSEDFNNERFRILKSQILMEVRKNENTGLRNALYPIVQDFDLHYINFGKSQDPSNMYKRIYCDGLAGSIQMQAHILDLLSPYWDNKWLGKINAFGSRWLGWVSPIELIVMFYINLFHKRLFKGSSEGWKTTLSSFPLVSHGVTAGFNLKNYNALKMLPNTLPSGVEACELWNSNTQEDPSKFPGIDDATQVCIVTANSSEVKKGKRQIMEAYMDVPGEGQLCADLHPFWG